MDIQDYLDFDLERKVDRRISMSGYMFQLFSEVVNWMRKKKNMVTLSIVEEEYMVATQAYEILFRSKAKSQ
jgi:hypothetical protein